MADKKAMSVRLADLSEPGRAKSPRGSGMTFALWLLLISWPRLMAVAAAVYVLPVALFAGGYLACGGVTARPGYFGDAFLFSVQVFARVNLGFRMPETGLLQLLVICELLMGWLVFIVSLALLAARFLQVHLRGFAPGERPPDRIAGRRAERIPERIADRIAARVNDRRAEKLTSRQSN